MHASFRRSIRQRTVPYALGFLTLFLVTACDRETSRPPALTQEAYVWQRQWGSNVLAAVSTYGTNFSSLIALGAEIQWVGGLPRVVRVPIDYAALRTTGRPIGLALRVGSIPRTLSTLDTVDLLKRELQRLVQDATKAGFRPAEVQLDFDCAESRLDGYRQWIVALRPGLDTIPLVVTALPSWLKQPAFKDLARAADGFVLQVHSLERPATPGDARPLCDPALARRAVDQAGLLGVPFRVALPTYGYLLAFGTNDQFIGASAEGTAFQRPAGTKLRELRADPEAMAGLVQLWTAHRPAAMRGLLWYRLPVAGDQWNWRWPTLRSVMAGHVPMSQVVVRASHPQPLLTEVELRNDGDADHAGPLAVRVRCEASRVIAADGIHGFHVRDRAPESVVFENSICRLPAGGAVSIGWVRLDANAAIQLELVPATDRHP